MIVWFGDPARPVGVAVEREDLVPVVQSLFRPLLLDGPRAAEPDLILRGAGSGIRLLRGDGTTGPRSFRSLSRALSVLEHQATLRLLETFRAHAFLHAGGVRPGEGAVLLVGPSGSGKSSLVLAASVAGVPVLSDDCVLVDASGRVRGLTRLLKVHRRQMRLHGLSEADTVAPDPRVPEVWWDPARSGGWATGWGAVRVVARIHREAGRSTPLLVPLARSEGVRLLLDNLLAGGIGQEESLDRLLGVARGADFVDLRFALAGQGMEALLALAGAGGS